MTTTTIAAIHGTRLRVESVVPMYAAAAWTQRPPVGVLFDDNSTGVSEVEYRHR